MTIGTVMNGIKINMEISITDAETFTMSTIGTSPPNGTIGAFTAGANTTTEILTTTGLILILVVMTVGGVGEKIVLMGGMATGTSMVKWIFLDGTITVVAIIALGGQE